MTGNSTVGRTASAAGGVLRTGLTLAVASWVVGSNHLSDLCIMTLFAFLPIPLRFLAKRELFRIPISGRARWAIGIVEVDRRQCWMPGERIIHPGPIRLAVGGNIDTAGCRPDDTERLRDEPRQVIDTTYRHPTERPG